MPILVTQSPALLRDMQLVRFAWLDAVSVVSIPLCLLANALELFLQAVEVLVGKGFKID
jgi:hypothetical protein